MATAAVRNPERFFVPPAEQEQYALRVFHRFPELFHTLGDPLLPTYFDFTRSYVDLQDSEEQTVLRVHLHRAAEEVPQAPPGASGPMVFDVSTPQTAPKRPSDPLSSTITTLEPLYMEAEQDSDSDTQEFPWQPRKPDAAAPSPGALRPRSPAVEAAKRSLERGQMQKSTPVLKPGLSSTSAVQSNTVTISAPVRIGAEVKESLPSKNRSSDDEEVWHPGQSSDEELLSRRSRTVRAPETGSASPLSSEGFGGNESPFFPWKMGSKSLSSSSSTGTSTAAHLTHLPRTPSVLRDGEGAGTSRSLAGRRGLQLQLSKRCSAPAAVAEDDMDSHSCSPSNSMGTAGVQLMLPPRRMSRTKTLPADLRHVSSQFIPRPRPVPFPHRRNVIFFDWDDTLCPTSWIRKLLKEHMADAEEWLDEDLFLPIEEEDWRDSIPSWFTQPLPDEPHVREIIKEVQRSCIKLIQVANNFGLVCIVTNAVPGWVDKTIKRWLPELRSYIGSGSAHCERPIKVIYAQQAYVEGDTTLPFADEQGEYMLWKKAAMTGVLEELDSLYCSTDADAGFSKDANSRRIANVLSIGDTEAEMMAAKLASVDFDCSRSLPRIGKQYCRGCGLQPEAGFAGTPATRSYSEDGVQSSGSEGWNFFKDMAEEETKKTGGGYRHSVSVPWSGPWPWVKLIKLHEGCQGRRLATQMDEMCELLPKMIALRQHVRVNLDEDRPPLGPRRQLTVERERRAFDALDALNCSEEDLQLERRLRVGTV